MALTDHIEINIINNIKLRANVQYILALTYTTKL